MSVKGYGGYGDSGKAPRKGYGGYGDSRKTPRKGYGGYGDSGKAPRKGYGGYGDSGQAPKEHETHFISVAGARPTSCMRDYKRGKQLGTGAYGRVYNVCEESNCGYVMKIQRYREGESEKEVYFAKYVYQLCPSIVPQTFASWECEHKFFIVSEMFDSDMARVGELQLREEMKNIDWSQNTQFGWLFTEHQLLQMLAIASFLSDYGIIHSDLKPDNFLYSRGKDRAVITDFGLAGFVNQRYAEQAKLPMNLNGNGWMAGSAWKCDVGQIDSHHPLWSFVSVFNLFQLIASMLCMTPTIIRMEQNSYKRFGVIGDARLQAKFQEFIDTCPNLTKQKSEYDSIFKSLPQYSISQSKIDSYKPKC